MSGDEKKMTHQEIEQQDLIERYVRKQLSAGESAAIEEHFFACDKCFDDVQATERFVTGIRQAAAAEKLGGRSVQGFEIPSSGFGWLKPAFAAAAFAILALLMGLGWLAFYQMPRLRDQLAQAQHEKQQLEKERQQTLDRLQRELESEKHARARLEAGPDGPGNKTPRQPTQELKTGTQLARNPEVAKSRTDAKVVSRTIVTDPDADTYEIGASREWDRARMGKPLAEVRAVYLQAADDDQSRELRSLLQARIAGQSPLQAAASEQADAAMRISVRPATTRTNEKRVIVLVQVVNTNGYVVWPGLRRESSWRYVGSPNYVADRVLRDLSRDITRSRGAR